METWSDALVGLALHHVHATRPTHSVPSLECDFTLDVLVDSVLKVRVLIAMLASLCAGRFGHRCALVRPA